METLLTCIKCFERKPLAEYYNRSTECKACVKKRVKARADILKQDPAWVEKERERGRLKFHRLYKDTKPNPEVRKRATANYKAKFPEKIKATAAADVLGKKDGLHNHHWSYNQIHWKDVVQINHVDHATAHRFMIYDQERMMYRTKDGILLDTKEAHIDYINQFISEKITHNQCVTNNSN
jgi:hypothetical protein